MAEPLGELTRTHTCGALRPGDVGANVVLLGWVHRVRDLGGVLFIDVRDRDGVTQVVFDKDDEALMGKAKRLRSEFVVGVEGSVRRALGGDRQPQARHRRGRSARPQLTLLNEAKTPPFPIADDTPVSEDVRLKYRYLDLRRPRLQDNLVLRHKVTIAIRALLRRARLPRGRDADPRPSPRPRARATTSCRAACTPASSSRCRSRRSSSSRS